MSVTVRYDQRLWVGSAERATGIAEIARVARTTVTKWSNRSLFIESRNACCASSVVHQLQGLAFVVAGFLRCGPNSKIHYVAPSHASTTRKPILIMRAWTGGPVSSIKAGS